MEQKATITETKLSREVTQLFDTIFDLCGDKSTILTEIATSKEEANKTKEAKELELEQRQQDVNTYKDKSSTLSAQIDKFKQDFKDFDKADYQVLLNELNMDFDPQSLVKKVIDESPGKLEKVEDLIKKNEDECTRLKSEIDELESKLSELDQQNEQALRDQEELKRLLDEIRKGNEQVTKGQVTSIGRALRLSDEQINLLGQRLLFSDDLNIYYSKVENDVAGKNIGDLLEEAKIAATEESKKEEEIKEEVVEEPIKEEPVAIEPEEPEKEENLLNETAQHEEDIFTKNGLDQSHYTLTETRKIENSKEGVVERNLQKAKEIGIDIQSNVSALTDKDFVEKVEALEKLCGSIKDVKLNIAVVYDNSLSEINSKLAKLEVVGLNAGGLPLAMLKSSVDNFVSNITALGSRGIKLDEKELKEFSEALYINKDVFNENLALLETYDINLSKQSGKLALSLLAQPTTELADKIDAVIEAAEEDILTLNPEYLARDTYGILARIAFLKANAMDYRNNDERRKYKRLIEDPIQFKKELGGISYDSSMVVDHKENNRYVEAIIGDSSAIEELDKLYSSDTLPGISLESNEDVFLKFSGISQTIEGIATVTDQSYTVGGISFSINKFQRNITQLLATNPDADINKLIFAALAYNSVKSEAELREAAEALDFSKAMRGE